MNDKPLPRYSKDVRFYVDEIPHSVGLSLIEVRAVYTPRMGHVSGVVRTGPAEATSLLMEQCLRELSKAIGDAAVRE